MFTLPLGIGQIHVMHELFKTNPRLAALVLLLIMGIAIYINFIVNIDKRGWKIRIFPPSFIYMQKIIFLKNYYQLATYLLNHNYQELLPQYR